SAAFHVVAPAVPIAGQDSAADATTRQWITHVWTLVICRVDAPLVLKECDAASADFHCFGSPLWNIFEVGHADEVVFWVQHSSSSLLKHVYRCLAFGKAHCRIRCRSAVLIGADVGCIPRQAYEKLKTRRMSSGVLPFFKYRAERGQDLSVGIIPNHGVSHFMEQPTPGISRVQILEHLPAHVLNVE